MLHFKKYVLFIYNFILRLLSKLSYVIYMRQKKFDVLTSFDTVNKIVNDKMLSVARYGDGEYMLMRGLSTGFQEKDEKLGKRLKEVLYSDDSKCLVCIPRSFVYTDHLMPKSKKYWKNYLGMNRKVVLELTPQNKVFGDACFSRFYFENMPYDILSYLELVKQIWNNKDVYIVEGTYTKFGVGNDLLDNAENVYRIICPAQNAYQHYNDIYKAIIDIVPSGSLVLIALGMTATILAYDLSKSGKEYQAIDIGHLDIEYECFLRKTNGITAIPGKAVNEVGQNHPKEEFFDPTYLNSIVCKII